MRSTFADRAESMLNVRATLASLDLRIAGEFDDVRRHARRGWKIDE